MAIIDSLFVGPFRAEPLLAGQRPPGCGVCRIERSILSGRTGDESDLLQRSGGDAKAHGGLLELVSLRG
jgi:hypothetical protein